MLQADQGSGKAELACRYDPQLTAMDQLLHQVSTAAGSLRFSSAQDNSEVPH